MDTRVPAPPRLRRGFPVLARRSLGGGGKPAYDSRRYSAACCATVGSVPATVARRMSRGCDWS
jgi:hypothetical protein